MQSIFHPACRTVLSLGLLLALVMLVRASGDADSGAYTLVSGDDRPEFERGEWQIVELIRRGNANRTEDVRAQEMRVTFKGDKLAFGRFGKGENYEFKFDPNATPKRLDWTLPTVGGPNAIYQLERGTLKVAVPARGKERPRNFSDPEIEMVIIMKRVVKP